MAKNSGNISDNGTDIGDEQWIVEQANLRRNSDFHAAKAWLLVGRTLFSRNFEIQVSSSGFVTHTESDSVGCSRCHVHNGASNVHRVRLGLGLGLRLGL